MPPRRSGFFPFAMFTIGLGLTMWYGQEWRELEEPTEAYIENSVDANLIIDLAKRGPHMQPDPAGIERMRAQLRDEVTSVMRREREEVQTGFAVGLIALVMSIGALVYARLNRVPGT